MAQGTLYATATVTLNGSGAGTAKVGPLSAREVWNVANASVKTVQTTVTNEAQCNIYVGLSATQENFRDNTQTGSTGDATGKVAGSPVKVGNYIFAVWSGGDAGVQAQLVVTGTKDV